MLNHIRRRFPFAMACAMMAAVILSGSGGTAAEPPVAVFPQRPSPFEDLASPEDQAALWEQLRGVPHRIVYESFRGNNWELMIIGFDGSPPENLTRTPTQHELYPHASPDGSMICFMVDANQTRGRSRSVQYMNVDGTGRTLVADNASQPFWRPDGRAIAYLPAEYGRFSLSEYATRGLAVYLLDSSERVTHGNGAIQHLYAPCWTPDGRWVFSTVHGGMGYATGNVAIEANGNGVGRLVHVDGCRPDVRFDGRRIVWNATDQAIAVGELDLTGDVPQVSNIRPVVTAPKRYKIYHSDWSPDGRFIAFAAGPNDGSQAPGMMAKGWRIYVADAEKLNAYVAVTSGGVSDKEPDWVAAPATQPRGTAESPLQVKAP